MRVMSIQKMLYLHVALRGIFIGNSLVEIGFSLRFGYREMVHSVSDFLDKFFLRKHVLNGKFLVFELFIRGLG